MKAFWKAIGKGFAKVGVAAFKASTWASEHPEVIAIAEEAVKRVRR